MPNNSKWQEEGEEMEWGLTDERRSRKDILRKKR